MLDTGGKLEGDCVVPEDVDGGLAVVNSTVAAEEDDTVEVSVAVLVCVTVEDITVDVYSVDADDTGVLDDVVVNGRSVDADVGLLDVVIVDGRLVDVDIVLLDVSEDAAPLSV